MARPLKIYMRGDRVTRLQHLLSRKGYKIGDTPGLFGTATRSAVKAVQQAHQLEANGIADDALFTLLGDKPAEESPAAGSLSPVDSDVARLQAQLEALSRLLLDKGIISADELHRLPGSAAAGVSEPGASEPTTPAESATPTPPGLGRPLF